MVASVKEWLSEGDPSELSACVDGISQHSICSSHGGQSQASESEPVEQASANSEISKLKALLHATIRQHQQASASQQQQLEASQRQLLEYRRLFESTNASLHAKMARMEETADAKFKRMERLCFSQLDELHRACLKEGVDGDLFPHGELSRQEGSSSDPTPVASAATHTTFSSGSLHAAPRESSSYAPSMQDLAGPEEVA
jgi:hypothetical protein